MGLQSKGAIQATQYINKRTNSANMIRILDAVNKKIGKGKGSVTLAASGIKQHWAMRRNKQSPNNTTHWFESPIVE